MTIRLSEPLTAYFKAADAHDVPAMLATFAEGALVLDEGHHHRGVTAIREWMRETVGKYAFKADPIESSRSGNETVVVASVSGAFPGSPITLQYKFEVDGGKIVGLEVG